jgi:secondary thiamine-phosphate synthase enzyme
MLNTIEFDTPANESLTNLTERLQAAVKDSGVQEGLCVVYVPHTTAGITVNSGMDPATALDIVAEYHRLVPTRVDFQHQYDTPADASGHIKATLVGSSVSVIVNGGKLLLGSSQSVLFFEFDGPRCRKVILRILKD